MSKSCNSQEIRREIIQDNRTHWNTLLYIVSDPRTDENTLRLIAHSLDSKKFPKNINNRLQHALAFNPKTPIDVLRVFIESEDIDILENIAKRPNADPEILRKVAKNPHAGDFKIQKALVNNSQVPEDVLQKLAKSKEIEILWDIVNLKQASPSVLEEIYNNPVANDLQIQRLLARNKNSPEYLLKDLAGSTDTRILLDLINNRSANTSVFEKLENNSIFWKDENIGLQRSLAEKPNISRRIIEKLASSNDRKILETLYHDNPSVPPDLKEEYRLRLGIQPSSSKEPFQSKIPQSPDISNSPFTKNTKPTCTGKNIRNNLIGGAAGVLGFFLGGPIGAAAAYGTITGTLETVTTISGCQI